MDALAPLEETRHRMAKVVAASILVPGLGHLLCQKRQWALSWFVLCQAMLFSGLALAGYTQLDYGRWFGLGGMKLVYLLIPEMGNYIGTHCAALMYHSIERGGMTPEVLPFRYLGYLLSAGSGIFSCFAAAHAASFALTTAEPSPRPTTTPGQAALAALLFPGLGHWVTGRRFKAYFLGGLVLGLFLFGMFLGDFADFDRQRHPYYWAGQMLGGPSVWIIGFLTSPLRFSEVMRFQDAGLLFTTSAGMFNVVLALDAFHRAQTDWLHRARHREGKE